MDTSKKASNLLDMLDEEEKVEQAEAESKQKLNDTLSKMPLDDKIKMLYDQCLGKAQEQPNADIITTYIEDLYNPETTSLDKGNNYLNLMILSRLMEFSIMEFYFDEDMNQISNDDIDLSHEWWNSILNEYETDEEKYAVILDKNLRLALYTTMLHKMAESADKINYNNHKNKMNNVLSFLDEEEDDKTLEEYFSEYVLKKSVVGSTIMITPDMKPYFPLDTKNGEKLADKKGQVELLGEWEDRHLFEIDVNQIKGMKGFKKGAFFINEGNEHRNKYIINPEKPLVYYNVIDNPFLQKPVLKVFSNLDFKFFASATLFLRVEDLES